MLVNTNHSRAKYFSKVHTRHLMAFNNRPCRDVPCSASMQYKIPPKVLEIKYSQPQIFSLHFSFIRNKFAIMTVKERYISVKTSEMFIKASGTCDKVSGMLNKPSETCSKVSESYNIVSETCNKVSATLIKVV